MLSAATIAALEQRELAYILGERERTSKEVREVVLADQAASVPLVLPRTGRPDTELQAKEVTVGQRRYVISGFTHEPGGSLTEDRAGRSPSEAIGDERYDGRSSVCFVGLAGDRPQPPAQGGTVKLGCADLAVEALCRKLVAQAHQYIQVSCCHGGLFPSSITRSAKLTVPVELTLPRSE
jgi:hypothetical protein